MPIKFYLKELLTKYDITQKELSLNTGVRLPTISDICNNKIKQFPVSAMDAICEYLCCSPADFIEYHSPNTIDMNRISNDTYNELLLSKPFEGGIYKIKTSQVPTLSSFFEDEFMCVVIGNSISVPSIHKSIVIPLSPLIANLDLAFHEIISVFGMEHLVMCNLATSVNNVYLDKLSNFLTLQDLIIIKQKYIEFVEIPNLSHSVITTTCKSYYEHLRKNKHILFKEDMIKSII